MGMTLKELLTKGEGTLSAQEAKALAAQCRMDLDTLYTLLEERGIKIQEEEIEPSLDVEGIMAEVESAENNNDDLGIGADEDEDQSEENPADLKAAMDELLDDPVKNYLKQIGQIPLLSAEQEVELSRRIHAGAEAAHILQADRQKYGAPEYIKKNSARFSFEEDENSRSYTEDLDDDGNEKSSEDASLQPCFFIQFCIKSGILLSNKVFSCLISGILKTPSDNLFNFTIMYINAWTKFHNSNTPCPTETGAGFTSEPGFPVYLRIQFL